MVAAVCRDVAISGVAAGVAILHGRSRAMPRRNGGWLGDNERSP